MVIRKLPLKNIPFFALTSAGLEALSAEEMAALPGVSIRDVLYRRITASFSGDLTVLLSLRSVDDVFLEIASWTDIGRPRAALDSIRQNAALLDLRECAAYCAHLRAIQMPPAFSVTVSFVGKRNYTGDEIKALLAQEIVRTHHWAYQRNDREAEVNVRVFIDHEVATVGVRLGKSALHDRPYQIVHLPGGLKPSVAAALVMLAETTPHTTILDPCCGSGVILIEAALQGASSCGGDINPDALAAARSNAAAAGIAVSLHQWDARRLPLADASIDRIVCNLPWGRQVQIEDILAAFYHGIFSEMRRVLASTGKIVLLTNQPEAINALDLHCVRQLTISLFGQRPTILVFSRVA
jgi:tRNA (guanine6-N2)-methyltransferase